MLFGKIPDCTFDENFFSYGRLKSFGFSKRRRISWMEIPPSFFCLARERSIKAINLGLLLRETVSISKVSGEYSSRYLG